MTTLVRPERQTPGMRTAPNTVQTVLLACGVAASLLYALAHDALAALLYPGYSPFSQTISELGSPGAPTRAGVTAVVVVFDLLFAAFGVGVWRAATHSNQALRVTGALLVAWAATGPMWFPFPMTARGDIAASTSSVADVMHGVLGAVTYLLIAATIVAGAAALGRKFRIYSVVTLLIVFGFAVPYAPSVSRIAEGEPAPWLGVFERVSFFTWLVWVGVLALALIRRTRAARR